MSSLAEILVGLLQGIVPGRDDDHRTSMESEMDREARRFEQWLFLGGIIVVVVLCLIFNR
jgi:hypothetical protein